MRLTWIVRGVREVEAALEGLSRVAEVQLAAANYPALYESGVRYRREPPGKEEWVGPREALKRGVADCEDLVAWRVAELRRAGVQADPCCYEPRPGLIHCVVRVGGRIEDPSRILGMGGAG